jgi:hypothetical protein
MATPIPPLLDAPPVSDQITDYDRSHFRAYLFLLDYSAGGGDWRDAMVQLVGNEVETNPVRVKSVHDAHLRRAVWMTETGWRLLLREPSGRPQQ